MRQLLPTPEFPITIILKLKSNLSPFILSKTSISVFGGWEIKFLKFKLFFFPWLFSSSDEFSVLSALDAKNTSSSFLGLLFLFSLNNF